MAIEKEYFETIKRFLFNVLKAKHGVIYNKIFNMHARPHLTLVNKRRGD